MLYGFLLLKISIHAPIVGCDMACFIQQLATLIFQSTHPSWGATQDYIKELKEEAISIHAPIVGCDEEQKVILLSLTRFQSTHPSWGATL